MCYQHTPRGQEFVGSVKRSNQLITESMFVLWALDHNNQSIA